jgi:branched-chain amino acid transport system permease protein
VAERDVREPITVIIVTTGVWYVLDNLALLLFGPDYRAAGPNPLREMIEMGEILISTSPSCSASSSPCSPPWPVSGFCRRPHRQGHPGHQPGPRRGQPDGHQPVEDLQPGLRHRHGHRRHRGGGPGPFYNVFPTVGVPFDVKSFVIVVLGGLGSIPGALLGGVIIGLIESIGPNFMTSTWTEAIVYGLFLLVLFFKPSGLFGRNTTGKDIFMTPQSFKKTGKESP